MAIAFDSVGSGSTTAGSLTLTWTHTIVGASLADALAVVSIGQRAGTAQPDTITWGGTGMTRIRTDGPNDLMAASIWYLPLGSPASGGVTVTATWSGTAPTGQTGVSIVLQGCAQTGIPDAQGGANGASGTLTANITTVADNSWIIDADSCRYQGTDPALVMVAKTNRVERANFSIGSVLDSGTSTLGPATPAGTFTMDWTQSGTRGWAISVASFAPVAPPAALLFTTRLSLTGVGI